MSEAPPSRQHALKSAFARSHIDPNHLEHEVDLEDTCWIEYAYMHPWDRTDLFTSKYLDVYRRFYEKYVDASIADSRLPAAHKLIDNDRAFISGIWAARQHADRIGMPYLKFLNEVMESSLFRGRPHFPRPNQLYGLGMMERLKKAWTPESQRIFSLEVNTWDVRFQRRNYRGDMPQQRLRAMAIDRVRVRRCEIPLSNYLSDRQPILTEELARRHFGDQLTVQALKRFTPAPEVADEGLPGYLQPCVGLGLTSAQHAASCNDPELCARVNQAVAALMKREFGSDSPRLELERQQARDRQRKCRERKKLQKEQAA